MGPATLVACVRKPTLTQMFVTTLATSSANDTEGPIATDESVCLDANEKGEPTDGMMIRVKVMACSQGLRQIWKYDSKVSIFLILGY